MLGIISITITYFFFNQIYVHESFIMGIFVYLLFKWLLVWNYYSLSLVYWYYQVLIYLIINKMINVSYKSLISALPFSNSSPYQVANLYQSKKEILFETLENNNFSRNMLKHVNGFSKDNSTCGYYQEHSIHNLKQKHLPDCL